MTDRPPTDRPPAGGPFLTDALDRQLASGGPVVVELGCGPGGAPGVVGVDRLPLDGVDVVWDLEDGLGFLPDGAVDEVRSRHTLEHVEAFEPLMREVWRVLKPGGRHVAVVPHFSNPYFYSDYTHRRTFGLYSFDYFADPAWQPRRKVPAFYSDVRFRVVERELVFKSAFPVRNLVRQVQRRVFNVSGWMREWYEESWCYRFPCQEVRFVMVPEGK